VRSSVHRRLRAGRGAARAMPAPNVEPINEGGAIQMSNMAGAAAQTPTSNMRMRFNRRRSTVMNEVSQEAKELAEEFAAITSGPQSFASSNMNEDATFLRTADEAHVIEERYGKHSWQARAIHFIHGRTVQLILSILLMIDVAAVTVELFLEAHFPSCHFVIRDAVNCCPAAGAKSLERAILERRLGGHSVDGHHDICASGFTPFEGTMPGCDEHKWETVHIMHDACLFITVAVLSTFLVELLALLYIERGEFLKKPLYLLDLIIVVGTLSLEFFHRSEVAQSLDPAKVLILARCWRFIRVGHGLVVETHEHGAKEQQHMKKHCQELVGKLHRLHTKLEHARSMMPSGSSTNGTPLMTSVDSVESTPVSTPTATKGGAAAEANRAALQAAAASLEADAARDLLLPSRGSSSDDAMKDDVAKAAAARDLAAKEAAAMEAAAKEAAAKEAPAKEAAAKEAAAKEAAAKEAAAALAAAQEAAAQEAAEKEKEAAAKEAAAALAAAQEAAEKEAAAKEAAAKEAAAALAAAKEVAEREAAAEAAAEVAAKEAAAEKAAEEAAAKAAKEAGEEDAAKGDSEEDKPVA